MSLDDLGLIPTLEQYTAKYTRDTGIDVVLDVHGRELEIDPIIEVAVFRIVQEALNNIKKHSEASQCTIELLVEDAYLIGRITDNGIGFNMKELKKDKQSIRHDSGFGIYSMRQRAELLEGKLHIRSGRNRGTTIEIKVPLIDNRGIIEEEYNGKN